MTVTTRAVAVGIVAALVQALMLVAFAWPAANLKPRDLPVAVAGPQAAAVAGKLSAHDPGAFEIHTLADESAAVAAIGDREVYGAIVTGGEPRVLVASAASPVVAQQLTAIAQQLSGSAVAPVRDVVAADPHDPRGAAFGAMVLPLVMAGIAAGALLCLLVSAVGARALGLVTFGIAAGLLSMAVVQGWLRLLPGNYLVLAGVAGLVSVSVAGTIVALHALIGPPGIGLGALTMLLIGNPFSGATSAPELLPRPWGTIGQSLPLGAAASLLRSVAYFDGRAAAGPLAVLLIWTAAALVLLGAGALRTRRAPVAEPVPA
ncbi:ABC transporter permease [Nocardia aurantia]|uniref:ABC transporter permease n=1 Tax=Nocardia aurantia TaxID=2585199 RepID=A0A7K0DLH9_9NOCA|nr:ABC transporter permease [Nocardia aurantia]MQY26620.1 hypothetical protein [Nocardia aurantia]